MRPHPAVPDQSPVRRGAEPGEEVRHDDRRAGLARAGRHESLPGKSPHGYLKQRIKIAEAIAKFILGDAK